MLASLSHWRLVEAMLDQRLQGRVLRRRVAGVAIELPSRFVVHHGSPVRCHHVSAGRGRVVSRNVLIVEDVNSALHQTGRKDLEELHHCQLHLLGGGESAGEPSVGCSKSLGGTSDVEIQQRLGLLGDQESVLLVDGCLIGVFQRTGVVLPESDTVCAAVGPRSRPTRRTPRIQFAFVEPSPALNAWRIVQGLLVGTLLVLGDGGGDSMSLYFPISEDIVRFCQ